MDLPGTVGLDNEVVPHLKGLRPAGQAGRGNKRKEKGVMRTKKNQLVKLLLVHDLDTLSEFRFGHQCNPLFLNV